MNDLQGIVMVLAKILIVAAVVFGGYFLVTQDTVEEIKDSDDLVVIASFEECAAAGNPVLGSYPRQCRTVDGQHFVEDIEDDDSTPGGGNAQAGTVACAVEQRGVFCTQQYEPVCGLIRVRVQCITTPCPLISKTFGNACTACSNEFVESYTEGECRAGE